MLPHAWNGMSGFGGHDERGAETSSDRQQGWRTGMPFQDAPVPPMLSRGMLVLVFVSTVVFVLIGVAVLRLPRRLRRVLIAFPVVIAITAAVVQCISLHRHEAASRRLAPGDSVERVVELFGPPHARARCRVEPMWLRAGRLEPVPEGRNTCADALWWYEPISTERWVVGLDHAGRAVALFNPRNPYGLGWEKFWRRLCACSRPSRAIDRNDRR